MFTVPKKGVGQRPVIDFKTFQQIHEIKTFQDGGATHSHTAP